MIIDEKEISRLEYLSALSFSDEEKAEMLVDLNKITEFVSKINQFDVTEAQSLQRKVKIEELREDIIKPSIKVEKLLQNAPEKDGNVFIVPKVVE